MSDPTPTSPMDAAASAWIIRRDRGLTAAEQDEFLQWLRSDPRHGAALARHEAALARMMRLGDWKPLLAEEPNPDLFAPRRPARRRLRRAVTLFAAAAAVALGVFGWQRLPRMEPAAPGPASYLRVNEVHALVDGSLIEVKDGTDFQVQYTAAERRVKLVGGEAHFTVAPAAQRPFVVEANGIEVRAVGTAFNVRLDGAALEVLVTAGRVKVAADAVRDAVVPADSAPAPAAAAAGGTELAAGQRTIVSLTSSASPPEVVDATPDEIKVALGWQKPRLQFLETPLSAAIAEFNRHSATTSARKLVLAHPSLGSLRIGGTFRVDNVEGFVRLLQVTLELEATERGSDELVLNRRR